MHEVGFCKGECGYVGEFLGQFLVVLLVFFIFVISGSISSFVFQSQFIATSKIPLYKKRHGPQSTPVPSYLTYISSTTTSLLFLFTNLEDIPTIKL